MMIRFLTILIYLTLNKSGMAQDKIIMKIELDSFSNQTALNMGWAIIDLARSRNQPVAVEIARLTHTIFLFIDDGLTADKHNWLRRKINVVKRFEESSLSVKYDLQNGNMTLDKTFGLDDKDYLAKGGAIPVFVKGAGMIAIIAVSGLHDEEDHKIIIDALKEKYL
jgi:uncharacterized protein (UPF0303 family)